ncbi:MAG: cyanophycin synthetase [Patescibacteria group bacterium]
MKSSFVTPLFEKFAKEQGIEMLVEPMYRFVAQLVFPSGDRRYVSTHIDGVNGAGATEIARDKTYALFFLKTMGYSVPEGRAFFSRAYADYLGSDQDSQAAWSYAQQLGLPIILKPNSKSQGRGVWKIHSKQEFDASLHDLDKWVDIYRIERYCTGRDYRMVIYKGELICAYKRVPLNVCGNGRSNIRELLQEKKMCLDQSGRQSTLDVHDRRIAWSLSRNMLSFDSILEEGRMFLLLGNANSSSGGDIRDVTETIHESFVACAKKCARDMGLTLCGLDMLIDGDGSCVAPSTIIEINAGPGLANYASLGEVQYSRVEALYRTIFDSLILPTTSPQ